MKKFLLILLMVGLITCLLIGCNVTTPSEGEGGIIHQSLPQL